MKFYQRGGHTQHIGCFENPGFNDFAHISWEGTPGFPKTPAKKEIPKQKLSVIRVVKVSSRGPRG